MTIDFRASQGQFNKLIASGSTGTGARLLVYDIRSDSATNPFRFPGIYQIRNLANNRLYIGSTTLLYRRKSSHFRNLSQNKHANQYLQNDFNIYGQQYFTFEILELIEDKNILLIREQYYIDLYFDNQQQCYNIAPNSSNMLGKKHTIKTRKKMSENRKGEKNHFYGKKHTEETKRKMSDAKNAYLISINKKRKESKKLKTREEIKNILSSSHKGQKAWNKGLTKTMDERVKKISKSLTGKKLSEETKKKISATRKKSPVFQINIIDNSIVNYYPSALEAERKTEISNSSIIQCCKLKMKTAGGYIWKYAFEINKEDII